MRRRHLAESARLPRIRTLCLPQTRWVVRATAPEAERCSAELSQVLAGSSVVNPNSVDSAQRAQRGALRASGEEESGDV